MKKRINIVIATLLVLLAGCRSAKKETMVISDMQKIEMNSGAITPQLTGGNPASTSPVVYIYKTKADYSHQVPVIMDEARTQHFVLSCARGFENGGWVTSAYSFE